MKMENERLCIEISEHGAEVTRIYDKKKETELLWEGNPTYWKRHSPILFPNVGKTYKNKVKINGISYPTSGHGFARDNDFKCICTKPDKAAFLFSSGEETKEVYPFDFELIVTYILKENSLIVKWEVHNTGDDDIYDRWASGFPFSKSG
jgi:galactose mutarotase-like enzyme